MTSARKRALARKHQVAADDLAALAEELAAEKMLVATGRVPYTAGLGLEKAGVAMERGRVVIDDHDTVRALVGIG